MRNPRQPSDFMGSDAAPGAPILRRTRANYIVSAGKARGRFMQVKAILAAVAVAVALSGVAVAQGTQKPTTGAPAPKPTHVGRDVCATHPNLPQCS